MNSPENGNAATPDLDEPGSFEVIAIGGSAGAIEALLHIVAVLPPDLCAAILLVVHIPPRSTSNLPEILTRRGQLPASHAMDGETIQKGHIYIAPPDRHLLVDNGKIIRLGAGPRENHARPAVDPLMRTVARVYGPRAIGVTLSGALSDGAIGLYEINQHGGTVLVQDPAEALFGSMPRSALDSTGGLARVLGADAIGVDPADIPNRAGYPAVPATASKEQEQ